MHALALIIAITVAGVAFAQDPPSKPRPGITPAALVLPVPGAPLSAESVEERITKLPDGTSRTEVITSKIYRDATGRVRTEMNLPGVDSVLLIQIMNQAAGFMAMWVPQEKVAHRFLFPKREPSAKGNLAIFGGPLIEVAGEKTSTSENLGKQTMEGVEFEGTRTTTRANEQPSLVGIQEFWFARDLGLIGLTKSIGPTLETTARLRNLDRHAPDSTLFEIPPDYLIRDLPTDDPPQ
jgi:hypothetical protein